MVQVCWLDHLALFFLHQVNQVNFHNDCGTMTAPYTLSQALVLLVKVKKK